MNFDTVERRWLIDIAGHSLPANWRSTVRPNELSKANPGIAIAMRMTNRQWNGRRVPDELLRTTQKIVSVIGHIAQRSHVSTHAFTESRLITSSRFDRGKKFKTKIEPPGKIIKRQPITGFWFCSDSLSSSITLILIAK